MKEKINPHWGFDTLCVHAGEGTDTDTKAIRRPIHMANSYEYPSDLEELLKTLSWDHLDKFHYTREHSPTASVWRCSRVVRIVLCLPAGWVRLRRHFLLF